MKASTRIALRASWLFCVILFFLVATPLTAWSQTQNFSDPRYTSAVEHYNKAEYKEAQEQLELLSADTMLTGSLKQRTYSLLSQIYLIRRDYTSAKAAMREWILTEPPRVSADADKDMPAFVKLYYEVRKEINQEKYCPPSFTAPHPCQYGSQDPGVKTVAIVDFENLSIDDADRLAPMSRGLAHIFLRHLKAANQLIVVERELINTLLSELELNATDAVRADVAVRVGHILGAHSIVAGHFMHFNGNLSLEARLIEVESSTVLLAESAEGKLRNFQKTANKLSEKVIASLGSKIDSGALEGDPMLTNNLEALLKTSEGNDFFDQNELEKARKKYLEALEHAPNYELARQRLKAVDLALSSSQ